MGSSSPILGVKIIEIFELPPARSGYINLYKFSSFRRDCEGILFHMDVIESALIPLYHTSLLPCSTYLCSRSGYGAPICIMPESMPCGFWLKQNTLLWYYTLPPKKRQRIFLEGCLGLPGGGRGDIHPGQKVDHPIFQSQIPAETYEFKTVRKSRYEYDEYHVCPQFHDVIVESQDSSPTADPPPNRQTNWWLISSVQIPRIPDVDFGVGEKSSLKTCTY